MASNRISVLKFTIYIYFFVVIVRLFYWQIVMGPNLKEKALSQVLTIEKISPKRGSIFSSDLNPLAANQEFYYLSLYKPNLKTSLDDLITQIIVTKPEFATQSADQISKFKSNFNQKWQTFSTGFDSSEVSRLQLSGISFQKIERRYYPENNLARNTVGFTRQDNLGNIYGISGLEGYYNKQLAGRSGFFWGNQDATGKISLAKKWWQIPAINGVDLYTSINRPIQNLTETVLKNGISKYSADSGSIIIMKPDTGQIIAMTSMKNSTFVATSSATILSATPSAIQNSAISDLFEPGSIFKPLVVSMALDTNSIGTSFICSNCNRPHTIGQYTISNWDNKLHSNSTLEDIIKNSDNIGMSYIIREVGLANFTKYFQSLGLATKSGIDLQGEARPLVKTEWPEIDLATASFGQGFAINQVQMIRAFNTIANGGFLISPKIVIRDTPSTKIFNQTTIDNVKSILKYAVENGVVAKFKPKDIEVCAKSGTAQVAVKGSYTDSSSIASYIGFSPCFNPQYTMIVTINNPRTSPWGSSTAAPIWYEIASAIRYLL